VICTEPCGKFSILRLKRKALLHLANKVVFTLTLQVDL
jgi:hypothetical protein